MDFVDARDLGEALAVLASVGREATVLAGGTVVVGQIARGALEPACLLHVRRIPDLAGVTSSERTAIGPATSHREIATDLLIAASHPALAEAASLVGGRQIQNTGTIGGNIANAAPTADLVPPLLIADARVRLTSATGERELALADFLAGGGETVRSPDELITLITLERPATRTGETYLKCTHRGLMEFAILGVAARVGLAEDGTIATARLAVCAAGPVPFRAQEAERCLIGRIGAEADLAEAAELVERQSRPVDDVRGSATYRRRMIRELVRRSLATGIERARQREEAPEWN